jgi:hypothetical protein
MKLIFKIKTLSLILIILSFTTSLNSQTSTKNKMEQLKFMVGDWVGISTSYKNDTIESKVPAYQKISYKLDKNIITIDLLSETLQLHTIIYYDDKADKYCYNSYYKGGTGKYTGEFKDNKFVVSPSKTKRFIFHSPSEGVFQEYGEKLENGKWVKYFEDNFKKSVE